MKRIWSIGSLRLEVSNFLLIAQAMNVIHYRLAYFSRLSPKLPKKSILERLASDILPKRIWCLDCLLGLHLFGFASGAKDHWKQILWEKGISALAQLPDPYHTLSAIVDEIEEETQDEDVSLEPYINEIFTKIITSGQSIQNTNPSKPSSSTKIGSGPVQSSNDKKKLETDSRIVPLLSRIENENTSPTSSPIDVITESTTKPVLGLNFLRKGSSPRNLLNITSLLDGEKILPKINHFLEDDNKDDDFKLFPKLFPKKVTNQEDETTLDPSQLVQRKIIDSSSKNDVIITDAKSDIRPIINNTYSSLSPIKEAVNILAKATSPGFLFRTLVPEKKQTSQRESKRDIFIIDTDCTVDDALALMTALTAEANMGKVKIVGITTVAGKTTVENATGNVCHILKTFDRLDVPVYEGEGKAVLQTKKVAYQENDFGNHLSSSKQPSVQQSTAYKALADASQQNPGMLSLICLGPLTNVALTVKFDPSFVDNIGHVFIIGGSTKKLPNAEEFNFNRDPIAAQIVFDAFKGRSTAITVLPWEPFRDTSSASDFRTPLGLQKTPALEIMYQMDANYLMEENWYPTILVALAFNGVTAETRRDLIDVEICGEKKGTVETIHWSLNRNAEVVYALDMKNLPNFLKNSLYSGRTNTTSN